MDGCEPLASSLLLQAGPLRHFVNDDVKGSTCWETLWPIGARRCFHHDLTKLNVSRNALSSTAKQMGTKLLAAGAFVAAFFAGDAESAA